MKSRRILSILVVVLGVLVGAGEVAGQTPIGTTFTYQGWLMDDKKPADNFYDFEFRLYDANMGGTQEGNTIDFNDLKVTDGYFTVELDFGSGVFEGDRRWLEITAAQSDGSEPCTLSPRMEVTLTPYAIYAKTAGTDKDWQVDGNDMYSVPSGNVGIGTIYPQAHLHIRGTETNPGAIRIHDHLRSGSIVGGHFVHDVAWTAGSLIFEVGDGSDLQVERMRINGDGNVGIGTTSPERALHVNDVLRLEPTSEPLSPEEGDMYMDSGDHKLKVYDGATWRACW